jgi:hypothetical protein
LRIIEILNCDRRRAGDFKHHFDAPDVSTEDVIFWALINRALLDYPARNAECFYVSKRSVGVLRESKGNESPRLAAHDDNPYFYCKTRKFGPTFALIRDCFVKFRFSSVAVMKNQGN